MTTVATSCDDYAPICSERSTTISARKARDGVTLLELLVTMLIMGLLYGMSLIIAGNGRRDEDPRDVRLARVRALVSDARGRALRTGEAVTVQIVDSPMGIDANDRIQMKTYSLTALPDGSILAELRPLGPIDVDRLTGQVREVGDELR